MRKSFVNVTLAMLAILLLFVINALAQAPATMVYQGRLADTDGNPIVDEVAVNFAIYGAPDADPVDSIWSETLPITPDDQGVFTVELGTTVPLTTSLFNGEPRFLGIKVGDDAQMIPFQLLASAPYAISATPPSRYYDSTMTITANGVRIGDPTSPGTESLLRIERNYNHTGGLKYGIWSEIHTSGNNGGLVGGYFDVYSSATTGGTKYGIYSTASGTGTNYAGYFSGNVTVTGMVGKGGGSFKIDHPNDPANKYLYHSFVESPDMMNVYNGNITTDVSGFAVVELPEYFNALNKDFRYQLTVIGDFAQAIIAEEISGNQFAIRTDKPSVKVSWQVTGIRKDAFAEANRIQVEVEKPIQEKGLYLHPEAFKLGPEMQIHHELNQKAQETTGDGHE